MDGILVWRMVCAELISSVRSSARRGEGESGEAECEADAAEAEESKSSSIETDSVEMLEEEEGEET